MLFAMCPLPSALGPGPYALSPLPYALCPLPYALLRPQTPRTQLPAGRRYVLPLASADDDRVI